MSRIIVNGRPSAARPALVHARSIGAALACLASAFGPTGWARAEDGPVRSVARAPAQDMSTHNMVGAAGGALPPALPEPMSAPVAPGPRHRPER